jgi:hypothetical protein
MGEHTNHVKVNFGTLKTNVLIGSVLEKYGVNTNSPMRNISEPTAHFPHTLQRNRKAPLH